MKILNMVAVAMAAGLLLAAPAFAQTTPSDSTSAMPAAKQSAQSLSHSDGTAAGVTKQN